MRPPILALKDVRLVDGATTLFDGVDLALEPGVKACLVGRNGAGKSTLMRLLMAQIQSDAGERVVTPGARISVVPQEPKIVGETLLDYATAGGALGYQAEATLTELGLDPAKSTAGLHDRAFLERTTTRCFWLEGRKVRRLDKGFAAFDDWSEKQLEAEADEFRRLNVALAKEEHWLQRGVTGRRARNEGRRRRLMAMREQKSTVLREARGSLNMEMAVGSASGKRIAYIDQARADLDASATLWEALTPGGGDQVMVGTTPRHVVETPGGWKDFLAQNPGFFTSGVAVLRSQQKSAATVAAPVAAPKAKAKLTYKDQRRLEELEGLVASLPLEIRKLEAVIADPGLYARDPAAFDRTMKAMDAARAKLEAAEEEWLALEEKRESLSG
eukprot:gene14865-14662_t